MLVTPYGIIVASCNQIRVGVVAYDRGRTSGQVLEGVVSRHAVIKCSKAVRSVGASSTAQALAALVA